VSYHARPLHLCAMHTTSLFTLSEPGVKRRRRFQQAKPWPKGHAKITLKDPRLPFLGIHYIIIIDLHGRGPMLRLEHRHRLPERGQDCRAGPEPKLMVFGRLIQESRVRKA